MIKSESHVDISLSQLNCEDLAGMLSEVLADTYVLYLKTQNFHWNVKGPSFPALHLLFEKQYGELAEAVDLIAERIRALGYLAPGSFAEFLKLTALDEGDGELPAQEMIVDLMRDHEKMAQHVRTLIPKAEKAHDQATVDLLSGRSAAHEKAAWMLRSSSGE